MYRMATANAGLAERAPAGGAERIFVKFPIFLAGILLAAASVAPAQARQDRREAAWAAERQQDRDVRRGGEPSRRQSDRMTDERGRFGHLTPEERQQLRRDIREHGRDVYRDRPRRQ